MKSYKSICIYVAPLLWAELVYEGVSVDRRTGERILVEVRIKKIIFVLECIRVCNLTHDGQHTLYIFNSNNFPNLPK